MVQPWRNPMRVTFIIFWRLLINGLSGRYSPPILRSGAPPPRLLLLFRIIINEISGFCLFLHWSFAGKCG